MRKKRSVTSLGIVGEITQFKRQMARILFWKVVVVWQTVKKRNHIKVRWIFSCQKISINSGFEVALFSMLKDQQFTLHSTPAFDSCLPLPLFTLLMLKVYIKSDLSKSLIKITSCMFKKLALGLTSDTKCLKKQT